MEIDLEEILNKFGFMSWRPATHIMNIDQCYVMILGSKVKVSRDTLF